MTQQTSDKTQLIGHNYMDIPSDAHDWTGAWPIIAPYSDGTQGWEIVGIYDHGDVHPEHLGTDQVLADIATDGTARVHDGACDALIPRDVAKALGLID